MTGDWPGRVLPFTGLSVIVTGDVAGFTRDSANTAIVDLGGKAVGSVSGKTGLVIIGDGAGLSKMAKTRTHHLNVIDGDTFAALVATFTADPLSWNGQPVGEPVADYEARTAPEPVLVVDPRDYVPMGERHLVGKGCAYVRVDGASVKQYRMWCQCGHMWFNPTLHAPSVCPVGAGTATLSTAAPWETT